MTNLENFVNYVCALPYPKRAGRIPQLFSNDPTAIAEFVNRWSRAPYGIYECVSLLRAGSRTRSLENVGCSLYIHFDIDLRALKQTYDEALQKLMQALPPWVEVRDSGGGFHLIIWLKEPVEAGTVEFDRANAARSILTDILCADKAPNHAAALLRKLGTPNFKYENPKNCRVIRPGNPVDITEIEDLIDALGSDPILTPVEPLASNGHDRGAGEPRSSDTRKEPVDAEARLASMQFQGAGNSGIHVTQLHCSASLLRSGIPVDDVVASILEATKKAVADDPRAHGWSWSLEKLSIERMCYDFVSKNPELASLLPDKLFAAWSDRLAEGRTEPRVTYAPHLGWHIRSRENKTTTSESNSLPGAGTHTQKPSGWNYYDTTEITPQRWCVKKIIPETGVGVLAGMWGSYKTTTALELAVSIMTGQLFANQYRIKRQGAVLYFATEGAGTLQSRLTAVAKARGAPAKLPFAWRCDCPALTDRAAATILNRYVDEASAHFRQTYDLPVSFVGIDTYINAANLAAGDDNDAAVTQRAFSTLRAVANHSGAFVLVVDHYGKVAEAGTRGSSAKEGNADTVLATLAEREDAGTISRTRMAARKQRDGMSGFEVPFTPEVIELGLDEDGDPTTAVILNWGKQQQAKPPATRRKSRDADLLAKVLADVVARHGFAFQPAPGAPTVQAVYAEDVQKEFYDRRTAKGTATQQRQTRWRAYNRGLEILRERDLVGTQELNGSIVLWKR